MSNMILEEILKTCFPVCVMGFLYSSLQSCFLSLYNHLGVCVEEISLISLIYDLVTDLTDKTCCSIFFVISKEGGENVALKISVTELLCDLLHETTPHGNGKLTTRFLYAVMWTGVLA